MADENKKSINPAAAGVVGAVIGAAAAGAAIALSDKDNRKKVGKAIKEVQTEGSKRFAQLKKAADQVKNQAVAQIEKNKAKKPNPKAASSRVSKVKKK